MIIFISISLVFLQYCIALPCSGISRTGEVNLRGKVITKLFLRIIIKRKYLRSKILDLLADIDNLLISHILIDFVAFLLPRKTSSRIFFSCIDIREIQFICETSEIYFLQEKEESFFSADTVSLLPGCLFACLNTSLIRQNI